MLRKYLMLLAALGTVTGGYAQVKPCGADEMRKQIIAEHPEVLKIEQDLERQIQEGLKKIDFTKAAKTTFVDQTNNESFWYDIPIVVHIVHDYNAYNTSTFAGDFIPDDFIFEAVKEWNRSLAKQNPDTADVIAPFKKYIGNPRIRLHLATIDPVGNPTKGITRRRNYLTYTGGQQSKFDNWSNTSYINIWFIAKMSTANGSAAAYAHYPSAGAVIPYYDGIISLAEYMNNGSKTIPHELGHVMNLKHVWGDNNNPGLVCGDDDVDDTPPTKGHNPSGCSPAAIYDTTCSSNYFKLTTDSLGNVVLINYPDTNNAQNIMDYTYCDKMFTKLQARRMHLALNSDVAGRNRLWDSLNLINTGALAPRPDLKPIPEFISTHITGGGNYLSKNARFIFPGSTVRFTNMSWNDTLTALEWTFTNGASTPTSTSLTNFNNSFSVPGWASVTMKATGNNSGDTTVTFDKALYIAEETGVAAPGYFQEFVDGADMDKWPSFNYYNNEFAWKKANVGYYDNSCIMYSGFDTRLSNTTFPYTGSPKGDFDDLFTRPIDFTGWGSSCNLNFYYSGASRSSLTSSVSDTLLIEYNTTKTNAWSTLAVLSKGNLCNKGAVSTYYTPGQMADWEPATIALPAAAITPYTVFRFRYRPGVGDNGFSSGNNFYLDRVHFSPWVTGVNDVANGANNVKVVPNPTKGDAYVVISNATSTNADIIVTDIAGKVVYKTTQAIGGAQSRVLIPSSAISVQGMYLVQVIAGSISETQKLVVY